jgi:hypothetical protein
MARGAVLFALGLIGSGLATNDGDVLDGVTGCPKVFKSRCTCGPGDYRAWKPNSKVYITNCTNAGFTSPDVLEYVPDQTEVLIFTGNKLETLPWNLLGVWDDHKKLEVIDLSNNGIKEIQGKTFHKVNNVKRLILNHNDLYIVSTMHHGRVFSNFENLEELHLTNAFTEQIDSKWYLSDLKDVFLESELKNLKKLHLEQNEIWEIKDDDMFCQLPALLDLHLSDNQITDINFSLECLQKLRYLDLEFNRIRNLPQVTLEKLDKAFGHKELGPDGKMRFTRQVDLHGNPFSCDCHMQNLAQWLKKNTTNLMNKDAMRCYDGTPEINAGRRIKNVEKFECPVKQEVAGTGSHHAVTSTLLTVLIILTACLLAVVLWINRITVKDKMQPLLKNLQNHMQYTTIEKQDEEPPEVPV